MQILFYLLVAQIIQAFLPGMIEKRRGHIVAINSSAGLMPCSDMVPYCAAKFGLRGDDWQFYFSLNVIWML